MSVNWVEGQTITMDDSEDRILGVTRREGVTAPALGFIPAGNLKPPGPSRGEGLHYGSDVRSIIFDYPDSRKFVGDAA